MAVEGERHAQAAEHGDAGARDEHPVVVVPLGEVARALGMPVPRGVPLALGVSVDTPELPIRDAGLGPTAPANLYHFVTHPAIAYIRGD